MSSSSSSSKSSVGAVTIPFAKWREACQRQKSLVGKENLRDEAAKLFSKLFSTTQIELAKDVVLTTKSSHNEALAQLIQELGPCFVEEDTSHITRAWALYCLSGAVEGCEQISPLILNLLGNFLLKYCAPLEEDPEDEEDTEESVRDAAILCLAALVQSEVGEASDDAEVLTQRINLAQTGVERRCAKGVEEPQSMDYSYGGPSDEDGTDVRGGLSLLPRSRRSLCFALIRAGIDGVATMKGLSGSAEALAIFAAFAANCMHGESDPRCLMQLLLMLQALQKSFQPFFPKKELSTFPKMSLFDAVAPYYPIQFTPPPNDKYGITRLGLQQTLMAILAYSGYDAKGERESMINLSSGILLERLTEEEPTQDKLEAVQDLNTLLLVPTSSNCHLLSAESVRELSHAMIATHIESASGVATGKQGPFKALADECRSLVSRVAATLESNTDLWTVFAKETLENDAPLLATSPQSMKGRSTIAYLACLAASGGPRTLQASLEACLPRLSDALQEKEDEEKVAAAGYGLGAFFSALDVALRRGGSEISFHPHPLAPYSASMLSVLGDLFETSDNQSIRIAAFRAMVSLLMVLPAELVVDNGLEVVTNFLLSLSVLVGPEQMDTEQDQLKETVAKSLGSMIGVAIEEGESAMPSVLRSNDAVRESIRERIFPGLLKSCLETAVASSDERFDVLSIACACKSSDTIADQVLDAMMSSLLEKVKAEAHDDALRIAKIVALVLKEGGATATTAFHRTQVNPIELIQIVGHAVSDGKLSSRVPKVGMSILELPSSEKQLEEEVTATDFGNAIVLHFLAAYETPIPTERLKSILDYMVHILPPLSEWQTVQLGICLPLFSVMLKNSDISDDERGHLSEMVIPLTGFALDANNNARSRSEAASCLFWIIARHQTGAACLSHDALQETVFPEVQNRLSILQDPNGASNVDKADGFVDALNFCALLGSGAACRGTSSTKTSNDVAKYLIQLAIAGQTQDPLDIDKRVLFASSSRVQIVLQVSAASAFGAMIAVDAGSPFWRQRLIHLAMKEIEGVSVASENSVEDPSFWGELGLVTQIVACGNVATFSSGVLALLSNALVKGLSMLYPRSATDELKYLMTTSDAIALQELLLAGIIKLMAAFPASLSKYTGSIVSLSLRLLSRETDNGVKVLALQVLCMIDSSENDKAVLLVLKPAVESVLLRTLDHPSAVFRQVVVETRNIWSIMT